MSEQPPVTPDGIMQLGMGFWASKTLLSAVHLGLFTELAAGALSVTVHNQDLMARPRSSPRPTPDQ